MQVSSNWLVNVQVSLSTAVTQLPAFNNSLILGVFSNTYRPTSFGTGLFKSYSSSAQVSADFSPQQTAASGAGDLLQLARLSWLVDDATAFFAQSPTPSILYVAQIPPEHVSVPNWATYFPTLTAATNNWYSISIADLMLPGGASGYGQCIVSLTTSGATTIPAGTVVTPMTASASYTLLQSWAIPSAGTYMLPFYSTDGTTAVSASSFNAISPTISAVTTVTNVSAAITGIPGFDTTSTGVIAGLTAMRSAGNPKTMFQDTLDPTVAGTVQAAGGYQDLEFFYHSLNLQAPKGFVPATVVNKAQLAASSMSEYFTDLFSTGVGLKPISSMQLTDQPTDPTVTDQTIGQPATSGSSSSFIGWNNNVYALIGSIGLVQYGYTSDSTVNAQKYIDEKVGADYLQAVAQANISTLIINAQPTGGLPYNDSGIQQVVQALKNGCQSAVLQNIIQPFSNSDFVYLTYAQMVAQHPAEIAARQYNELTFNGKILSRIQTIKVLVNLSLT